MTPELRDLLVRTRGCLTTCFNDDEDDIRLPERRTVMRRRIAEISAALEEDRAKLAVSQDT